MASGRKRKKPVTLAGAMGRIVEVDAVQDPYERPGVTLNVARVSNESPIHALHKRGRLAGPNDKSTQDADRRKEAADKMQGIYERAGGRGASAIDYTRVKVDVSMVYRGTPDKQAEAHSELRAISRQLGEHDFKMLHAVCCEQIPFMRWVESQFPDAGRQTKLDAYARLRDALDGLIGYFGVAIGRPSRIRASAALPEPAHA